MNGYCDTLHGYFGTQFDPGHDTWTAIVVYRDGNVINIGGSFLTEEEAEALAGREHRRLMAARIKTLENTAAINLKVAQDRGAENDRLTKENAALRKVHACVLAYQEYLRKSVNVGPLTSGPSKEARLLRELYEASDNALRLRGEIQRGLMRDETRPAVETAREMLAMMREFRSRRSGR